ncbi:MAG: phosphate acyltransferase PlsX [candidate division FCPU426 bacterium]
MIRVAVDAMTAEKGVQEVVHGAIRALKEFPDLQVLLAGDPGVITPFLKKQNFGDRLVIVPATQVIGMDEEPGAAYKAKKDASVSVATRLIAEGRADAVTSPGNTGASLAAATFILGRIKGLRRPAIMALFPASHGSTALLDCGAWVDCKPEALVQWGLMGSVYMKEILGVENPRVGLLSIGEEESKGNTQVHETFPQMKNAAFNFIGNVEGRDLFNGRCDVCVCDGFVGNIVLKTAEGLGKMLMNSLKESFQNGSAFEKIGGLLAKPSFNRVRRRVSAEEAGGSVLLGVNGIFVITHGSANRVMMKNAIRVCYENARQDILRKITAVIDSREDLAQ